MKTIASSFSPLLAVKAYVAVSVSVVAAATGGTMTMPSGRHAVVTGPVRRSSEATYVEMRAAVFRASMRTHGRRHAVFLPALPSYALGVAAGSVEVATTRRAVHAPGRTTLRRRSTESVGRATGRTPRPSQAPLTGPASSKMLVTATPSPACHGANCLAFDEPQFHQAVGTYAERAQQRPSLVGAEVDAAGDHGGVQGTPFLAVAVSIGLEALGIAVGIVSAAEVAGAVVGFVVVRVVQAVLSVLFVPCTAAAAAAAAVVDEVFVRKLTSLIQTVTRQDQRRRFAFTALQKSPRC